MTADHMFHLTAAKWRSNQPELFASGHVVHTLFDGTVLRVGDYVEIKRPIAHYSDEVKRKSWNGILVIILDQGLCLISDKYWMQVSRNMLNEYEWELIDEYV